MAMSHYDLEDVPPLDGDTQIDMYISARQAVADAPVKANAALDMIGAALEELYTVAESRQDSSALLAINDAWEKVQSIAAQVGHQNAALTGADKAIEVLRNQRESLAYELEELLAAVDDLDTSHPVLESAFETLRESADEMSYEWATERLYSDIYDTLRPIAAAVNPAASVYKLCDRLVQLLTGDRALTATQNDLLHQLIVTIQD